LLIVYRGSTEFADVETTPRN